MGTKARYIGGVQSFYDDGTFETVHKMSPVRYQDDFLGAGSLVIPAAGSGESGADWVKKIVGAAPPAVAGVANAIGGQISCALTSASQKQDAGLYWGDQKGIDVTKGAVFEARIRLSVLPSATGVQAVAGLSSDWIDGPDNNTCYIQVQANGSGLLSVRSYDGVTATAVSSGVTLTTADWAIVRIDCTDVTDVSVFINGDKVTTSSQINFAATGTLAVLQPYLGLYKASGTGVGTMLIDFVKIWQNR
ncbi:hypothetical protein [Rhizobium sp. SGZ-381]|uniref:hypothetical protein n=1 Tax=Rhizobium sp. SGZ-381 TaxID=3342800 RepID=UPI0036730D58